MKLSRRELLAVFAYISGLGTLAAYMWSEFEAYRGYIVEKRIILRNTNRTAQTLTISEENNTSTQADNLKILTNRSDGEINDSDMEHIMGEYHDIEFKVATNVYNDDSSKEQTIYSVSREQFNQVNPGEYISFQISISDNREIASFSCIAPNRSSLQSSCQYDKENWSSKTQSTSAKVRL